MGCSDKSKIKSNIKSDIAICFILQCYFPASFIVYKLLYLVILKMMDVHMNNRIILFIFSMFILPKL